MVVTDTSARRLLPAVGVCVRFSTVFVPAPVLAVAELLKVMAPVASRVDETSTIAILSAPVPTVWLQLRLACPASAVLVLVTASKAIGSVAGFLTFVLSTVIDLRQPNVWASTATVESARSTASAAHESTCSRLYGRRRI